MKILIINQAFWPDVVATAQHMSDWAQFMAKEGHQVSIIASRSLYSQNKAALPQHEIWNNVHIYRVGFNLFRKGRILTRLIDFGMFHLLALWRALWLPKQDVVVCLTTPPFIGVVGAFLKCVKRSRYVQYEMDLYPDVPVSLGVMKKESLATRFFEWVHRRLLRSADRIVVLGRCMKRVIASKEIDPAKMVLVTPWADPNEIQPIPHAENPFRKEHQLDGKFVVMYSGNLGLAHDIETLCAAMDQLRDDDGLRFVFVGSGRRMDQVADFVNEKKIPNVLMLGYQPREKLSQTLVAADVHLITQLPTSTGLIVPSKLYGILAAQRPMVLVGSDDSETALTLAEADIGKTVPVGDVQGLIDALNHYRTISLQEQTATAESCRKCLSVHSRDYCCNALTEMVQTLQKKSPPSPAV